jgi:hypothetical protein
LSAPAATSDDAPLRLLFAGADESVAAALVTALGDRLVLKVVGASDDALALVRRSMPCWCSRAWRRARAMPCWAC